MKNQESNNYKFSGYVTPERWVSFYEQICAVAAVAPERILEVGVGSAITYTILKKIGFDVTSFDNDTQLKPDVAGDLMNLDRHFKEGEFDCICCFQVLEHLPFQNFTKALEKMAIISSRYVIISLPYDGYTAGISLGIGRSGCRRINLALRIPRFWHSYKYDGKHYWEIGAQGFYLPKIRRILARRFNIKKEKFLYPNKSALLFVLEKKV